MDLHRGLPLGFEAQAAALYWQAFKGKLGTLMGPDNRACAFFEATLNRDAVIAATQGDVLLGLTAFKRNGRGFSIGEADDLWRHYGLSSLWRMIPLAMLERTPPSGTLQMDGICVAEAARGQGVGTALFDALFTMADEEGFAAITLDVIDTNPRAKALYERLGFKAQETHSAWPLRRLLGFRTATRMVRAQRNPALT